MGDNGQRRGVCSVDGCDGIVDAKMLCKAHYNKMTRHGNTEGRWTVARDVPPEGLGVVKCFVCGDPVRDHPMRPCDKANVDVFRVPNPSTMRKRI